MSLSNKIMQDSENDNILLVGYVKESVKRLKKKNCLQIIDEFVDEPCDECMMCKNTNEEFGPKLIDSPETSRRPTREAGDINSPTENNSARDVSPEDTTVKESCANQDGECKNCIGEGCIQCLQGRFRF